MKKTFIIILSFTVTILSGAAFAQETVTLNSLIESAKQNNAEIIAASERLKASRTRITQAKTLDNPKLGFEYWSIPEGSLDIGSATEKMYGIDQMIPFPGKLSLRGKVASSEADAMQWEYKDTELKVLSELKSAYAMYYYLNKSIETYSQTAEIMRNFSKVAESRYVVGKSAQSDVLRAQVEAEKMSTMVITLEQEKQTVQAEINLLIGNNIESPLGEPENITPAFADIKWEDLKAVTLKSNPEIGKSNADIEKGKWSKKMAKAEYLPDFDIGFRRKTMDGQWAGSDFMVGVSVPLWFWKQRAAVNEMSYELKAAESNKKNTELMAIAKLKESFTKLEATHRLIGLYADSVIPKSEQSLKAAQTSFIVGKSSFLELLDSVRSNLEFKLEYYNYISEYQKNIALLERTVGTELTDGGKS